MVRTTPSDPLPQHFSREVVRDLLGITRALYRAERAKPTPDPSRLARLEDAGRLYRVALDMGRRYPADTIGGRAALTKAERATVTLGELVEESEMMAPAVAATAARLQRTP